MLLVDGLVTGLNFRQNKGCTVSLGGGEGVWHETNVRIFCLGRLQSIDVHYFCPPIPIGIQNIDY
jgi:hypothetical protein